MHHAIDGSWAADVQKISQGRLLLGGTATPQFATSRDVRRFFPYVLARKTMREGIEEGLLAPTSGFLYKGTSKIVISRKHGSDWNSEEVFNSLINSRDNYLAAAICAGEVALGRRGVVSCVPGYDRAHAKVMAKILSMTPVVTQEGEKRFIRSAYVDGETNEETLVELFEKYKYGDIDVLTYIDLLIEGWDSPETEFGVMVRPTKSRGLHEQRMGRIVRPYMGKLATLHEIIYEIVGDKKPQVTHLDIFGTDKFTNAAQPRTYRTKLKPNQPAVKTPPKPEGVVFDIDSFAVNSGMIEAMGQIKPEATQDTILGADQESIPFSWNTLYVLANKFNISADTAAEIIASADKQIELKTLDIAGAEHTYYSPSAVALIADRLHIEEMPTGPEAPMTERELSEYIRNSSFGTKMRLETIHKRMAEAGIEPVRYITSNQNIIKTYPREYKDVPLKGVARDKKEVAELDPAITEQVPQLSAVNWLARILVNPKEIQSPRQRREIILGQNCLLKAFTYKINESAVQESLAQAVAHHELEPNYQMKSIMQKRKLSFAELIIYANAAKTLADRVNSSTSSSKQKKAA
jgi:hypothetical protein